MNRIYLDHAATTPIHPDAQRAMLQALDEHVGNASSLHWEGRRTRQAIDVARERISGALGCSFAEVLFTSSGTESANWAIVGSALAGDPSKRPRVLLASAEHHCVLNTEKMLQRLGFQVSLLTVDRLGRINLDALPDNGDDVLLVSVMHANNEIGAVNPVREVAEWAKKHGVIFHCDAVQTFGWSEWTTDWLGADLVSVSAHKLHGPAGVGALFVRAGTKLGSLIVGGAQERDQRAGTENVVGIVGFGAAAHAITAVKDRAQLKREARDTFLAQLKGAVATLPEDVESLPGHAHVRFPGVGAESLLIVLDRAGVSASSGAACSSGSTEPSHVLQACGWSMAEAREAIRFSWGFEATLDEAITAARLVNDCAEQIRSARGTVSRT